MARYDADTLAHIRALPSGKSLSVRKRGKYLIASRLVSALAEMVNDTINDDDSE